MNGVLSHVTRVTFPPGQIISGLMRDRNHKLKILLTDNIKYKYLRLAVSACVLSSAACI